MNIDQLFLTFGNHWNIPNLRVLPSDINPGDFNFTEVTMDAVTEEILKIVKNKKQMVPFVYEYWDTSTKLEKCCIFYWFWICISP